MFLLVLACLACGDDEATPASTAPGIDHFGGILRFDANGQPLGGDTTDWRTDLRFTTEEQALFGEFSASLPPCNGAVPPAIAPYPNPFGEVLNLRTTNAFLTSNRVRIVDRNYRVYYRNEDLPQVVSIDTRGFPVGDTLRVYYQFEALNCAYRGYGDILREN